MELMHYVHLLRRRLWLVIVCPLIAVIAVTAVSLWLPPVYEARVSLLVRPSQPLTADAGVATLTSDQISRTYASLMTERPLMEKVIADLSLQLNPDQLRGLITVAPETNTTILNVSVRNTDPRLARDIANQLVDDFIKQVKEIQQQEARAPNSRSSDNLVVVSPAATPTTPVSPKLPLNIALAFGAGLLVALGFTLLLEYLDQSIKGDEDLTRRVGMTTIGHIPLTLTRKGKLAELVALSKDEPAAEAYKSLRTNLVFATIDQEARVIIITSPAAGEGKSRTSSNLALVLAQAGHRTLLIDADFRRPSLHRVFGRVRNVGLSNFFLQDVPESELVLPVEQVPNLWLITSGPIPPNPSELLGSSRMKEVLTRYRQAFTYIIIDTPPVNPVTDPSLLAGYADGTVLVIEQGRTTYASATHAKRALERVGARTIGVVMNKLRSSGGEYYYDNTYYGAEGSNGSSAAAATSPAHKLAQ